MPPKNKKDAEEEAKRLQQQRKKKEEEEARLQLERKKYAAEILDTGLLLPSSCQLIIDFKSKCRQFISQKLTENLLEKYPQLEESEELSFYLKELQYYMKDSRVLFGETENPQQLLKHRIFIGIMTKVLLNDQISLGGELKVREKDQKLVKNEVALHCTKKQNKQLLTREEGLKILQYAGENYFGKYLLITEFRKFPKRKAQTKKIIYLETPCTIRNTRETKFTDLSAKNEIPPEEPKQ